jgi:glycine/serine hydroxymethyltransferase
MEKIVEFIDEALIHHDDKPYLEKIRNKVNDMMAKHPLYKKS